MTVQETFQQLNPLITTQADFDEEFVSKLFDTILQEERGGEIGKRILTVKKTLASKILNVKNRLDKVKLKKKRIFGREF